MDSFCLNDFWILGMGIIVKIQIKKFVCTTYVVYYATFVGQSYHIYVVYYTTYVAYYTTNVNSPEIPILVNLPVHVLGVYSLI